MSPAEEERSLPLPERWPRASKFALSACAAAVAELGTTHRGFPRGKGVRFTYGGQGEHQSVPGCLIPQCSAPANLNFTVLVVAFPI